MPSITVSGIVLRTAVYKEYDKIITIFAREHGLLVASAPASRRIKSPLLNAANPFVSGEFVLTARQGRYTLSSCSVEEAHYALRNDPIKLAYASYLCAVCQEIVQPDQASDTLYETLLRALAYLCYGQQAPDAIALAFLMHMLVDQGIAPILQKCSVCGGTLAHPRFIPHGEGAVCHHCAPTATPVDNALLTIAQEASVCDFSPTTQGNPQAFELIASYVTAHFDKTFTALHFLKKMQGL